jgi:hypothetical protein
MTTGRTWDLYACRYVSGKFMHIGEKRWVELHQLTEPIVSVRVEEILDDPIRPDVTHYGWEYTDGSALAQRLAGRPSMIQIRAGEKHPMGLLAMCFPYGLEAQIESGEGRVIALRVTEQPEPGSP